MSNNQFYVYILTNSTNNVLYTGITNNLVRRIWEDKNSMVAAFTKKYNVKKLVYFEIFQTPYEAITREKQIKAGSREKKLNLIEATNKNWRDLYEEIV